VTGDWITEVSVIQMDLDPISGGSKSGTIDIREDTPAVQSNAGQARIHMTLARREWCHCIGSHRFRREDERRSVAFCAAFPAFLSLSAGNSVHQCLATKASSGRPCGCAVP
jgi:hypothetical protein